MTVETSALPHTAVRFRADVELIAADGELRIRGALGSLKISGAGAEIVAELRGLTTESRSVETIAENLSPEDRAKLAAILDRGASLLIATVTSDGHPMLEIEATAQGRAWSPVPVPGDASIRLSKFALLRMRADTLVLESPLAAHRVRLIDSSSRAVVGDLAAGTFVADLAARHGGPVVHEIVAHLVALGFVEVGEAGTDDPGSVRFPSDTRPLLRQWEFHDLLAHSRGRAGRFDEPFGGIFPFEGEIAPQPAVKRCPDGPRIPLHRPDFTEVARRDPTLIASMEGRMSIRRYAAEPLTVVQLGEFLYRTARVRAFHDLTSALPYEVTTRPYPCGGAAYELDLYLTVERCAGLAPGVYYYDAMAHHLVLINESDSDRRALLRMASTATAFEADPQVLLTMTARFQRLSWKYRRIAYAVSLRHSGVLYQTMYLVATAMGLAPCGLGSGDSDLAARVFGLDYLEESSIGDFLLGAPGPGETDRLLADQLAWTDVNDRDWAGDARVLLDGCEGVG
ncbi:SagB-type dehydrogenase domain-containing protein [Nocardia nova SH22a]|uniref:SagB-type dehydrogenase domain-containing protein n=1 Tax=Nocardia nova SH22a TaxID=1415166 RepID=W5T6Q2_9NOCA|nr:SagB family peptide dehydrogenase [Nocardia nova]AHH14829.1 SagB-type dehydrogenase domain-containing protein [Nocardia nova SH22a]